MTWAELLDVLRSMEAAKHTSMDEPVELFTDSEFTQLDVFESLTTGLVYFNAAAIKEDEVDG